MQAVDHFLEGFFNPKSVAIVGATDSPFKLNFQLMGNLIRLNYQGQIYPINLRAKEVMGNKAYARLMDIPDTVDLVIIAVPASNVMDVLKECKEIGIKNVVIVTGGFSEGGDEGKNLHQEISSFIKDSGIRALGPNTLSPINTSNNFAVSFSSINRLKSGGLSLAFQSGFYDPKINWIFSHLGVNKILDMGNKMDINEVDALEYFLHDPATEVVAIHIESIRGDGRKFFDVLKAISRKKPTIILKTGRTSAGSKAAASHTGSIAGEDDVIFDSAINQTSAIRAKDLEEFFDLAKAFSFLELPQGNSVAVITISGGEGVMATDACEMNGMQLANLGEDTYEKLKQIFPPWEIPVNPLDCGACFGVQLSNITQMYETLAAIPEDKNVDCVVMQAPSMLFSLSSIDKNAVNGTSDSSQDKGNLPIVDIKRVGKPFAMWCFTLGQEEREWIEYVESCYNIPVFQSSDRAIRALSAMHSYRLKNVL